MLFSESLFVDLVTLMVISLTLLFAYQQWKFQYWRRRNFPYLEPRMPFGNTDKRFKLFENPGLRLKNFYDQVKAKGWKHAGLVLLFGTSYLVVDLDYIKNILTKDFQYFTDRGIYYNEKDDPLSAHLFNLGGVKWRHLRAKLTPTFTSGKMKMMFQTLLECELNLLKKIAEDVEMKQAIDMKEVLGCFTTDIIGSCAFGLDCQSFNEKDSPFRVYGSKHFTLSKSKMFKFILSRISPNFARQLGVTLIDKDVSDFFIKIVKDNIDQRKKNNFHRKDFIQLLMDLKDDKSGDSTGQTLTLEEIAAQCFVFFVAGFETSSTTMSFALYELATHQNLQQKLRDEITQVLSKHDGKITYEAIQEMKYMDQVINETLRIYPPLPLISRECVKDYKLPDQDLVIERGTRVVIPIYGIHHDKELYPNPETFDPERFSEENKSARHHYAHIPFGEGPRLCIGLRFGLMQSKVGMASLLKNYNFTVNERTKQPLTLLRRSFILGADGGIWLNAQKI